MISYSSLSNSLHKLVSVRTRDCLRKRKRAYACLPACVSMSVPCRKGQQRFVPIPELLQTELLQSTVSSRGLPSSPQILEAHSHTEQHSEGCWVPGWLEMNCTTSITLAEVRLFVLLATVIFLCNTWVRKLLITKMCKILPNPGIPNQPFFQTRLHIISVVWGIYSSNPVCPCPMAAVQLITCKGWQIPVSHPSLFHQGYKWAKRSPYCKGSWL